MAQDLAAAPIYMFKVIIMAFAGLVMGVLCRHTRSLVGSLLKQEQEQQRIKDAFGKYVSAEIRDEVLAGRVPLDGEMKDVTVLFADLRDFTPLTSSRDPKEVVRMMNGYFSAMAAAIREQGGLVLQYIGDEIYAVFGAPLDQADHPGRAFAAAREMSRRLEELNRSLAGAGRPTLAHGIGLHSGEALAANLGSPERLSYLLVGETVNLASRLQGLCKKLGVEMVVSAETARRLPSEQKERAPLSPLPAQQVKGFPRPVEVFTPAAA